MSKPPNYKYKLFGFKKFFKTSVSVNSPAPLPRSGHRIICDDGNLYSYGGYNPAHLEMPFDEVWSISKPLFKELWKYNFATKMWIKLMSHESMPNELVSNAVVLSPGRTMLVYGGTGMPFGHTCSNQLYMCNLRDNLQLVNVEGQMPKMLYGQAMVLDRDSLCLYTVGGTTGFEYFADIHCLDIRSKKWEEVYICTGRKPMEPPGRYRHELAFNGQRIYVLGGGTATAVFGFDSISVFNLNSRLWELVGTQPDEASPPGFPAARRCHAAVQMNGHCEMESYVFISGGFNGTDVFDDVWRLELNSLQWRHLKCCKMPRPVYFHSASLTPAGRMYVFGGIEKRVNGVEKRTADVHAVWLCIPKLSDMCWDAIVHYTPNLKLFPKNQLVLHGIPLKYVEQIPS